MSKLTLKGFFELKLVLIERHHKKYILLATRVPFWDKRLGKYVKKVNELNQMFIYNSGKLELLNDLIRLKAIREDY